MTEESIRKAPVIVRLNAVGRPYGANYDPDHKMNYKGPGPARLRAPYNYKYMRFVGDPPAAEPKRYERKRKSPPAPLLYSPHAVREPAPKDKIEAAALLKDALRLMNRAVELLVAL
jgi:hypothetical protein